MPGMNDFLAQTLASLGLPMSEEPMLQECSGSYITWAKTGEKSIYASGKQLFRQEQVQVSLWVHPDQDAENLEREAALLLMGAGCRIRYQGSKWQQDIGRQQVVLACALPMEACT